MRLDCVWRDVPGQVHGVMENTHNLNHLPCPCAIHYEMPSASALARDVKAAEAGQDFVAGRASRHVRTGFERGNSIGERDLVNACLPRAEGVGGMFQDAEEVFFRLET
jgi:hypothetical protein